ncbi:hypothetical protein HY312_01410 [Candidatus Saccharibacteria bacterium]|nr:hypothetical protein [Candidatus Saccharibacteria bacterium]
MSDIHLLSKRHEEITRHIEELSRITSLDKETVEKTISANASKTLWRWLHTRREVGRDTSRAQFRYKIANDLLREWREDRVALSNDPSTNRLQRAVSEVVSTIPEILVVKYGDELDVIIGGAVTRMCNALTKDRNSCKSFVRSYGPR